MTCVSLDKAELIALSMRPLLAAAGGRRGSGGAAGSRQLAAAAVTGGAAPLALRHWCRARVGGRALHGYPALPFGARPWPVRPLLNVPGVRASRWTVFWHHGSLCETQPRPDQKLPGHGTPHPYSLFKPQKTYMPLLTVGFVLAGRPAGRAASAAAAGRRGGSALRRRRRRARSTGACWSATRSLRTCGAATCPPAGRRRWAAPPARGRRALRSAPLTPHAAWAACPPAVSPPAMRVHSHFPETA